MNSVTNLSPGNIPQPMVGGSEVVASTPLQDRLKEISLTILGPSGKVEGPGGEMRIRLENPTVGPEDIPVTEFLQQLDSVGKAPFPVVALSEALGHLAESERALGQRISRSIDQGKPVDPKEAARDAGRLEEELVSVESQLRSIIENSTYPNFTDYLTEMVKIAQQLREKATEVKMAAIEAKYNVMKDAADQMVIAAEKSKLSRDQQIEAEKLQAIGQIVSGVVSGAIGIGFGAMGSNAAALGGALSTAASGIITGSFGVSVSNKKTESSNSQLEADLATVAKTRLEAAAQLIDGHIQIAEDLRETAKSLRDMALKLIQDFISAQNQVLQRSNV